MIIHPINNIHQPKIPHTDIGIDPKIKNPNANPIHKEMQRLIMALANDSKNL
jgi:hypothetical protein